LKEETHGTPLICYVETLHGGMENYSLFIDRILRDLVESGPAPIKIVFWPASPAAEIRAFSADDIRRDPSLIAIELSHRGAAAPPQTGFAEGLRRCAKEAADNGASILLLVNSTMPDFDRAQQDLIKTQAKAHALSIVAVGRSAEAFAPLASGYAIGVQLGDVDRAAAAPVKGR
jgi:hypothetical protein